VVKAPGELIETALKSCPPKYDLAARNPEQDLPLDGNHVFVGTDGCRVEVLDIHTGKRRTSCLQDVAKSLALPTAWNRSPSTGWLYRASYPATTRSCTNAPSGEFDQACQTGIYSGGRAAVEMAAAIAGAGSLAEAPVLSSCSALPALGRDGGSLGSPGWGRSRPASRPTMTMAACLTTGPRLWRERGGQQRRVISAGADQLAHRARRSSTPLPRPL
jgi:trimethylamine--corrinoid protein Co-methyltransferase